MTEANSTFGLSPNQPIIQYSEGSTPHVTPSSHISPPICISVAMAENEMKI